MRGRIFLLLVLAVLLLSLAGAGLWRGTPPAPRRIDTAVVVPAVADSAPLAASDGERPLRIAIAAMTSPERTAQAYTALLQRVGVLLGLPVAIAQRKTYAETNAMVETQAVDVAFVCSGAYVAGRAKFGMEILAVPVVHGRTVYFSYILAPRESSARHFDDLRGKRFAFTDPHSNTGALVPRYMLAQRRATPESFFADHFFTYSHDNSIHAVAAGLADGAAVDSLIWDFFNTAGSPDTARTRVIETSPPYGIPPVVVHPRLDAALKARLRALLLSLHDDPEAAVLLKELQIERFVAGEDARYDSVREMERWIAQHPVSGKETP